MARLSCRTTAWLCIGLAAAAVGAERKTPVELGRIPWLRDYAAGAARAKEDKKPLLLLFQEVPG